MKQKNRFFRKGLCGILSVAMILTSSMIPDLSVSAAQFEEETIVQDTDTDESMDEIPSEESKEAGQSLDAADTVNNDESSSLEQGDAEDSTENDTTADDETEDSNTEEEISDSKEEKNVEDVPEKEVELTEDASDYGNDTAAAEDGVYTNVTVNLNYYISDLDDGDEIGLCPWGTIATDNLTPLSWKSWNDTVYEMKPVEGHANWYNITFNVTDTVTSDGSKAGFVIYKSSASTTKGGVFECSGYEGKYPEIYVGLLSGDITAVKDGAGYASIEDAEVSTEALKELVAKAKELKEEDYKALGWAAFSEALTVAEAVLVKESPVSSEVEEAYNNLEKAMNALVPASSVTAEINVKPVALADDFITGADISSYWSLKQSGTVFKDENGKVLSNAEFFQYLHDGGTNWVRIRVWNDPYDSNGNGYGGGNNDVEKAKIMGKLATDAGMRVLIDFHYSDFWADPGKQQAPKAWASMTVDERAQAVYQFTKDSLSELKAAGVDVGMVQIGNETTNGISGVFYNGSGDYNGWDKAAKIYNAGSKAVREFDVDCLVAVHFTNPERPNNYANLAKNLDAQGVDYDVFASSYYPFWHGTTENLTSVLANVAKTYGKKVMVAETSWATTLDDQDGHDNTVRKGNNDTGQPYAFSVQGQADEIRAVVEAANNINSVEGAVGSSIGVFYWESAWISPYYVYEEDGTKNEELYNKNHELWEKYGSGWAASYGGEYDPEDAGKWYGGSAVDNQAWFGFDGTALPTAKIYSYIRTGAEAEKAIADVEKPSITVKAGETVNYPEKVTVTFNDGTSDEYIVEWNSDDKTQVDTNEPGDHIVRGIVTCEYTVSDGSTKTATRAVTLTITVEMTSVSQLINPGFEDADMSAWTIKGSGTARKDEDPHSGAYGVHFYSASAITTTVIQKIENIDAGVYIFGGYIQGDKADANAVVTVYDKDGNQKGETMKTPCSLDGWANWKNPEVMGITVSEGDYLEVGMEVNIAAAGWGTMDDFYLYRAYEYDILVDDQIKNGTLSCSFVKSVSGEKITITATPNTGYVLSKLTISGRSVTSDTLASSHGKVTYDTKAKAAVLTYDDKVTEVIQETFTMPNGKVKVSAVFRTDVDTSALEGLIKEYENVSNDGYTVESWAAFTDAIEAAKTAVENLDATQTEIDSAKTALEEAYKGLMKAPAATEEEIAELSALIEKCNQITNDGYTEESWGTFTSALEAAKRAIRKENVTTTEISEAKEALEAAYKGLTKTTNPEPGDAADLSSLNALIAEYDKKINDNYTEESWKNFTDALAAAKAVAGKEGVTQAEADSAKAALEAAYAGLTKETETPAREGLWAEWTDDWAALLGSDNTITYTGKAIKPTVKVYDGETLLTSKSYSISYKNNTKVGTASVIIKGKGNYVESDTMTFEIAPVDLGTDANVNIPDLYVAASKNGNPVNVKPTVTWNGKKVAAKMYEVVLPDKMEGAYVTSGTYNVEVKAKEGNGIYTGSQNISITLVDPNEQVLMSSVKIKLNVKSKQWIDAEEGVTLADADITVKHKADELKLGTDYTLEYENNKEIGTATVIVKGTGTIENKGKFVGEQRKTFKITGVAIKARDVSLEAGSFTYDGTEKKPGVTVTGLTRDKDFTVTYQNNKNASKKATAIITGINGYTGTVKKTFMIAAYDVQEKDVTIKVAGSSVVESVAAGLVPYEKGGSKPEVTVTISGEDLVLGTDYTLMYSKNTKVTDGTTAIVKVKGKGNYTGTKTIQFAIGTQDIQTLTATAADQTSTKKWNTVNPAITDKNGKVLKKGTDYEKELEYVLYDAQGEQIADPTTTPPAAGMKVKVTATGKGNYTGKIDAEFRIIDAKNNIAKARITIIPQTYTGNEIEPQKSAITLEMKENGEWKPLTEDQYEILGYSNNINKGKKAKITIHGLGSYGGTKTFNFEIKAQSMSLAKLADKTASMLETMFN